MHFFVVNWLRREKSVSRTSFSKHKGAKLEEMADLQYIVYSGNGPGLFIQKRVQPSAEG